MTDVLRCPHCHGVLRRDGAAWRCAEGHAFDIASQGYVNLLAGPSTHAGDTAGMLDARQTVLDAGHLDAVTEALVEGVRGDLPDGVVVEVGAGTAHHLRRMLAATGRKGVALDVSKAAARRAARASPDITSVVADAWGSWPLLDGVAAAVLHVFAPRDVDEACRVLVAGGRALVTVPAPDHLGELTETLGLVGVGPAARKLVSHPNLDHTATTPVRVKRSLPHHEIEALVAMGPSARHLDPAVLTERLRALPDPVQVTIAVDVVAYTRRPTTAR